VNVLLSPVSSRAPERDRGTAEQQAEDFVQFWRAGARTKLAPPPSALEADLHGAAGTIRGACFALVLGSALWLCLAGFAFGLFTLIDS
jgi:hypothetical protein